MRAFVCRLCPFVLLLPIVSGAAFFPFAGRFLVSEDPISRADALFVPGGTRAERWLEAYDLYRQRYAPLIVLSPEEREPAEETLAPMGIRIPASAELARDALLRLGVPASDVIILPGSLDNTAQEANAVRALAKQRGWHHLIVVTSKYHTRRARFAFAREFSGLPVTIQMHATRYDPSDPPHWWRHRGDVRTVTYELLKGAAYRLGLGE